MICFIGSDHSIEIKHFYYTFMTIHYLKKSMNWSYLCFAVWEKKGGVVY